MVLLMGLTTPRPLATRAGWERAKLGFASLSASQGRALWRRADDHALAEAFNLCGTICQRVEWPVHMSRFEIHARWHVVSAQGNE